MFGYACDETPELMPLPIALAHRLARRLAAVRKDGTLPYLRPTARPRSPSSTTAASPVRLDTVVLSTQHAPTSTLEIAAHEADVREHVIEPVLPKEPGSTPRATGCWSTRPAASSSAARWATPA
jgi:S-adenosylmethionine synthetase